MRAAQTWLWTMVLLTVAALACAVVLAPSAGAQPMLALSWLLFTASSAHVASTGWLFTVPAVRAYAGAHLVRCLWVPCGLVVIAAAAAAAISPAWLGWLLLPYFGWQLYHYQKQNIGMACLAASAGRVRSVLPAERWPLLLGGWSGVAALMVRPGLLGVRPGSVTRGSLRLGLPGPEAAAGQPLWLTGHVIFLLAAAAFVVSLAAGFVALARRPRPQRPASFVVTYATCVLFFLPAFVFASPYAAVGGMTIAHGLQYLLLVTSIAGGRTAAAGSRRSRPVRLALLANVAFIGGAALSSASHLHNAGPAGRLLFGGYLGVVMAHFVIDAGLWRMRDPLARTILAGSLPYLVAATVVSSTAVPPEVVMRLPIDRQPI